MDAAPPRRGSTARGCAAALAIGAATVLLAAAAAGAATGAWSIIAEAWWILLVWMLMAAAPFGLLALAGIGARRPWLVGIALTVLLWSGACLYVLLLADPASGVNSGLALATVASPVVISAACFLAARPAR